MKTLASLSAIVLMSVFVTPAAYAGGGVGGPVAPVCYDDDGQETECPASPGGTAGPGTGTGTGTGTGGTGGGAGTGGTGTGAGTGGAGAVSNSPTTIGFNTIGATLSTYTEGDYVAKLVAGSITGGFGAYGTRGLDTLGPGAAAYVPGSPIPQFSLGRTDSGLFSVDSFYSVRLSASGSNTVTLQGYVGDLLLGTSVITSSFDGFGFPQPSGLTGAFDKVLFTLDSTSSGLSFDLLTVRAVATEAAVPEATTWTMMILGLGLVGFGMRSRRKTMGRILRAA